MKSLKLTDDMLKRWKLIDDKGDPSLLSLGLLVSVAILFVWIIGPENLVVFL